MAASGGSLAAWRHELSPWLSALHGRLSLSIDISLPDRDTLQRQIFITFDVPDQAESAIVRAWTEWLEALELLDLLATVDTAVCWALLIQLCDASELLRQRGCPVEFFHGARPKYEFRFPHSFLPTDFIMTLLLDTSVTHHASPVFNQTKSRLLVVLRATDKRLPRIRCRFRFALPDHVQVDASTHSNATLNILLRALALARHLHATRRCAGRGRFAVRAFGFDLAPFDLTNSMRGLLYRIAVHTATFELTYGKAGWYEPLDVNVFAPFYWRLLAPHANGTPRPRTVLGLRRLTLSVCSARSDEIPAMCAAIAQSQSLRELTFHDYNTSSSSWLPHLAFALFHKGAAHHIHTVDLSLHPTNVLTMAQLLAEPNPTASLAALEDAGAPNLRSAYFCLPLTRVRVNPQAKLVYRQDRTAREYDIKTLCPGKQDMECFVVHPYDGEFIRVLAPGVGFCRIRRPDILCETPVGLTASHPVRSLTLRTTETFDVAALTSLLARVGAPLTQLTVENVDDSKCEPVCLDRLLTACPCLKWLELSRITLSLKSFVSPAWGRQLESLTLRSCGMHGWIRRQRVADTMLPRLGSLVVDARDALHPPAFQSFLLDLAAARDLQRFIVACDDPVLAETYRVHTEKHNGERVRALPLRHKLALLSVVSAGGSSSGNASPHTRYTTNVDALTLIFEMVAPTIWRRMCAVVDLGSTRH